MEEKLCASFLPLLHIHYVYDRVMSAAMPVTYTPQSYYILYYATAMLVGIAHNTLNILHMISQHTDIIQRYSDHECE